MNTRWIKIFSACFLAAAAYGLNAGAKSLQPPDARDIRFNSGWRFIRCDAAGQGDEEHRSPDFNDASWERVELPHTPKIEPLAVNGQWQGICWYRKSFDLETVWRENKILIEFEGAMQVAEVWVNGAHKTTHYGGYLPFTVDVTAEARFDKPNLIVVRLDNRDNPDVPPGKPLRELDFCMYGGLYRNVKLHVTDRLHVTDAVHADRVAGGGVFVEFPMVRPDLARVRVQTHVVNDHPGPANCSVVTSLADRKGRIAAKAETGGITLNGSEERTFVDTLEVIDPKLWHPDSPTLYTLISTILRDGRIVDRTATRIGIRRFAFDSSRRLLINGGRFDLRGTNRHQEYPYIGYALPDAAQIRDARKIKRAGFDLVRLSHYPPAPAFLDACDELGILAIDAIPGWQFFGGETFQARSLRDCRDMIRRDRNHASVVFWEVSLNESGMTTGFMEAAHGIAHAECPRDQCFTCGWMDAVYDVFIPARQHSAPPGYWKPYAGNRPLFIAEYGDWEYYAQNAGFNQTGFRDLSPEERNSRQLRGSGGKRLLQQALNFQESYNDNLGTPAAGCANWLMFDYNRGYADDIEASGISDIFRLPKFAFYFYQSQKSAEYSKPMVFIADNWMENGDNRVKVFSNCDRVALKVNGRPIGTQGPDRDGISDRLPRPPFTFTVNGFESGTLEAVGFIGGRKAALHQVLTPLEPKTVRLSADCEDPKTAAGAKDVFFVYASIQDGNGATVPSRSDSVYFDLDGPGRLIGENPVRAEAGIAVILVETTGRKGVLSIRAGSGDSLKPGAISIQVK